MRAAIDRDVVVELEVLVVAGREDGRIAHRVVEPAGGDLREADVARVGRDAQQADRAGEVDAAIHAQLSAFDRHPAEAHLVQQRVPEHVRVAGHEVPRLRRQRPAESGHERFLEHARAERLESRPRRTC